MTVAVAQWIALMVLSSGSVYFWWKEFSADQRRKGWTFRNEPSKAIRSIGLVDMFIAAMLFSALPTLVVSSLGVSSERSLLPGVVEAGCCVLIFLLLAARDARYGNWLSIGRGDWRPEIQKGLRGFVMITPIALIVSMLVSLLRPYEHPTLNDVQSAPELGVLVSRWLDATVLTSFSEEFCFRGLLLAWLVGLYPPYLMSAARGLETLVLGELRHGSNVVDAESDDPHSHAAAWFAILVMALFFGAAHFGQGLAPIPLYLFAVFLGWVFLKSKSLWPCMIVHFLFNGYSLLWTTLAGQLR
jgi:membrane protease YdiL (CAAX protease family)